MKNNPTNNRKPANMMTKNAGFDAPKLRSDQRGDGADFAFNGQMGDGVNREPGHYNGRFSGNQVGLTMRENYGDGPRMAKDNSQAAMHEHGTPVTKDKYRTAPMTAKEDGKINGGRRWDPKMGQNYVGNPDKINVGN